LRGSFVAEAEQITGAHARYPVTKKEFRISVASDGSAQAKRAIATAVDFPWPARTRVRAVVARRTRAEYRRSILLAALDRSAEFAAGAAQRVLSQRWSDTDVVVVDKTPVDGVLHEAQRFGADAIVVGWRGHGMMHRLLMGSVSRGIVRGARCAVLVVRRRPSDLHKIVIGVDESAHARRAVAFVARLKPPPRGEVTLFRAVEQFALPAHALSPSAIRGTVGAEV
jgi:nucleotide-binding universal stress UspA family protein